MPHIGVIADDLTGATTTGVLLARSGAKTAVFFNEEAAKTNSNISSLDAILISSNSRALPPDEAYEKVSEAIKTLQSSTNFSCANFVKAFLIIDLDTP